MVNKSSHDSGAKSCGTGGKSGPGIISYMRSAKSFRSR